MQTLSPWWASESFWRKMAIWVTGGSFVVLIFLTFDTLTYIKAGGKQVPGYAVINKRIDYQFNAAKNRYMPVIGQDEPLFGKRLSEAEAEALVSKGKLTTQAKNCMECHTLLGNGAYYAPDLTKAWLDPAWSQIWMPATGKATREEAMAEFLMHPDKYPSWQRAMPDLKLSEEEARSVVAYLKWMSAIDTNGFPAGFGRSVVHHP